MLTLIHHSIRLNERTFKRIKAHKIVWCSKKPERGVLHASFKLSKGGGSLSLSEETDGRTEITDEIEYAAQQ